MIEKTKILIKSLYKVHKRKDRNKEKVEKRNKIGGNLKKACMHMKGR